MTISLIEPVVDFDSNMFLISGDKNVLIDTGSGSKPGIVIERLKTILDGKKLDYVILTHCHFDHIGGLKDIVDEFGCKVLAGSIDAIHIRNADSKFILQDMVGIKILPIDVTELSDGEVLDIKEHKLIVIDTPGHTKGSICIYDEVTSSLFSGDTVFVNGVGRVDFPSGSSFELIQSLERLSNIDINALYPGHGHCVYEEGNREIQCGLSMMGGIR